MDRHDFQIQATKRTDKFKFMARYLWTNAEGFPCSRIEGYYESIADAEKGIADTIRKCRNTIEPEKRM